MTLPMAFLLKSLADMFGDVESCEEEYDASWRRLAAGTGVGCRAKVGVYVTTRATNLHDHGRVQGTSLYFWGCASTDGISEPDGQA